MQEYDWVRAWAEVYGFDRELEVFVASGQATAAIAPLFVSRRRRLELAGPEVLMEAMDFLYDDLSLIPALAAAIARSRIPLRFLRIPEDSPVVRALRKAYRGRGIFYSRPALACPSLALDESWLEPEKHLDARQRSNVRRARKVASSMGSVTCEILSPRPADLEPLLREAYAVEADGWKSRTGAPLVREPVEAEFWRRYAIAACERGSFRLCFLRIDGRAAAMELAAVSGDRFWLLKMGYSEEFERCSPGTLLLVETIRYAAQSGLRSYEFLGGDEPWIRMWGSELRPCVSIRTYPISVSGATALSRDAWALTRTGLAAAGTAVVERVRRAVVNRAAPAYVAGPRIEDAVNTCRALAARGFLSTIGYVKTASDSPRAVARRYEAVIDTAAVERFDCYVSVKAPFVDFSRDLFRGIFERARKRNIGLHFDSLANEYAERTFSLIEELRSMHGQIGCTLPGRWRRSVTDAERAIALGLNVRVVKGESPDVGGGVPDARAGFLAVIDRIAGHVPHAAIATHDAALALEAVRRLRSAGTDCELEVLLGYPIRRVIPVAAAEKVPVRVYVQYGHQALPYSIGHFAQDPRVAGWALRDLLRASGSALHRMPTMSATVHGGR